MSERLAIGDRWYVEIATGAYIHILPVAGREHDRSAKCWCKPQTGDTWICVVVIHHEGE